MKNEQIDARMEKLPFPAIFGLKEIVVAGNYGGGNLGDEAMLDVLADLISNRVPGIRMVVPSRRPDVMSKLHRNPIVIPVGLITGVFRAFLSDMLIIGGGTIFSSLSGLGIHAIVTIAMLRKLLLRKPFYFYGIGYSTTTSKMLSLISLKAFNLADAIYVRDSLSYSYLKTLVSHKRIFQIPELAMCLKESKSLPSEVYHILRKNNRPVIGFSLMYVASSIQNPRVLDATRGFIEYLHSHYNAKCVFLTFQPRVIDYSEKWQSDSEIGLTIINGLPDHVRTDCHVLDYYPPQDTLRIIGELDAVVSMRYHCLVFAYMQKKPYLAISFDDKHEAFVRDCGGELLKLDEVSSTAMISIWEKMKTS